MREFIYSRTAYLAGIDNTPPPECVDILKEFCAKVLEPVREFAGTILIASGYRCPELNRLVHGVPTSEHIWTPDRVAADLHFAMLLEEVFDWICKKSFLPFDQCILERGKVPDVETDDCIHISYTRAPRRMALLGETHNRSGYQRVPVLKPTSEVKDV
jgi:hypothetical protein